MTATDTSTTETPGTEGTERSIKLGPLATLGGLLVVAGIVRRRKLALAAGLGAIWLDQRSSSGRALKDLFKDTLKSQVKSDQREAQYSADSTESSTRA